MYLGATRLDGNAVFAHHQREHDQRNELRSVRFGGSHANFRSGVDVHTAVRFAANGRADRVGHAENEGAASLAVAQGQ